MVNIVELRNTALVLRQWAKEILIDTVPAPYATSDADAAVLEKAAKLMEEAADEIDRARRPQSK